MKFKRWELRRYDWRWGLVSKGPYFSCLRVYKSKGVAIADRRRLKIKHFTIARVIIVPDIHDKFKGCTHG